MFGGSREKKALLSSADAVAKGFRESAANDRDAAYMTCAFLHFAITLFAKRGKLKGGDLPGVLNAYAKAIQTHAPAHGLPVSYLEDTRQHVANALIRTGGDPRLWVSAYYDAVSADVETDPGTFMGAIIRETAAAQRG